MLRPRLLAIALLAGLAQPAAAQLLPDVAGTVGGVVDQPLGQVRSPTNDLTGSALRELRDARETALQQLRRQHPDLLDQDRAGEIVIRREVVAVAPTEAALAAARERGFTVRETVEADELGLSVVVLAAPEGITTRRAVETLREIDPEGSYEYNHIYFAAGETSRGSALAQSHDGGGSRTRIGLIDSGVAADHPAFSAASIEQRGFGGAPVVGAHGTAIASILVGQDASFEGAAPGAALYVADVYGGRPNGGGASAIVAALNWLVGSRVSVINISLVGPSNRALAAAVEAAIARGCVVVAAVGNDGPAAAPLYPASYDGVIGVTGVDQRNRVLPEAGRGAQVDFAAPGMDFSAATPEGAYSRVRGTSYAAPIVAGLAASHISAPNSEAAERAQQSLRATAVDLGARGVDRVYGAGLIGADMRGSQHLARR